MKRHSTLVSKLRFRVCPGGINQWPREPRKLFIVTVAMSKGGIYVHKAKGFTCVAIKIRPGYIYPLSAVCMSCTMTSRKL